MPKILYSKPILEQLTTKLQQEFSKEKRKNKYLAIILLNETTENKIYVKLKKKFGEKIGFETKIFKKAEISVSKKIKFEEIKSFVDKLNKDTNCAGIIFQLPLPKELESQKQKILNLVDWRKDVDALSSQILGKIFSGEIDFLGATPQAAITLLNFYGYTDFKGQNICIIGQSNLIGKQLLSYFLSQKAEVFSFNKESNKTIMKEICKKSKFILSGTGDLEFLDKNYFEKGMNQIVIDIGYGLKNGKACGDLNPNAKELLEAYSPVPGGIGPLTVATIFENIIELDKILN